MAAAVDESNEANLRVAGKPQLDSAKAVEVAQELYGLGNIEKVKEFVSYDDRNFYLRTEGNDANPSAEYLMKVSNAVDSANPSDIEAQNSMMLHLAGTGVSCPVPVPDSQGRHLSLVELPATRDDPSNRHAVRLLTFIPGVVWDEVPQPPNTLQAIGAFVGRVTSSLSTFEDKAADSRSHSWDLARVLEVEPLTVHFEEPERRAVVQGVLQRFRDGVVPKAGLLPKSIIHGDINEQNLLLHPSEPQVTGLLDFGDVLKSWQVNDLAICMAYGMLKKEDPVAAAGYLLAGYLQERSLSDLEWEVLPTLVACRLAQSITMGNHAAIMDPSNKEYLLLTQQSGWVALKELWSVPPEDLMSKWKGIAA